MLEHEKHKQKIMLTVIGGGLLLMMIKFYAFFSTKSNAVWSDALESLANVSAGLMVFFALRYADVPADKEHPFGHGKIEYFTSGFEGALVLSAGIASVWKGISSFFSPVALTSLEEGIILSGIAGAGNALMGLFLIKKGKQMHSLALEADGKHLLSDALTSVGLILGLMVIKLTNYTYADGFLAMIFGLFIVKMGLELLLKSFDGLMDTASPETLKNITDAVVQNRKQNWVGFHDLKVLKAGNAYFVSYHLVLPWYFSLRETKNETDQINDLVSSLLGKKVEFSEHTEGCEKHFCKNCPLSCAHREEDFIEWLTWQHEHMIQAGVPAVK